MPDSRENSNPGILNPDYFVSNGEFSATVGKIDTALGSIQKDTAYIIKKVDTQELETRQVKEKLGDHLAIHNGKERAEKDRQTAVSNNMKIIGVIFSVLFAIGGLIWGLSNALDKGDTVSKAELQAMFKELKRGDHVP